MFKELHEKIQKSNDQRIKMAFTLINVMKNSKESTLELRTAVAASIIEMLDSSMMPEDALLVQLFNESIDELCVEAEGKGISNFKDTIRNIIKSAREKTEHIIAGESILNNINLN